MKNNAGQGGKKNKGRHLHCQEEKRMLCFFTFQNVIEEEKNDEEHIEEQDERKKWRRVVLESGDERISRDLWI